jgi:hypothetical protein
VGQQVTLTSTNGTTVNPRINLMLARAAASFDSLALGGTVVECDVIAKGSVGGEPRGWVREASGLFRDDTNATLSDASLRALAATEGPITYTAVPPGSGRRMGIDRDLDDDLDGLDNCPSVFNPDQADSNNNGIGDVCDTTADTDSDGVPDASDNCPTTPNAGQENFDGDGQGDACDADDDNDGLTDAVETDTGTFASSTDTGSDPFDADSDDDGVADGIEVLLGFDPNNPNSLPALPALGSAAQGLLVGIVLVAGLLAQRRRRAA